MGRFASVVLAILALALAGSAYCKEAEPVMESIFDVKAYGAKADGVADDTTAIQKALNAAGEKGGVAYLPAGKYLVKGSLSIPPGVALKGVAEAPLSIAEWVGSIILATGGRDNEDGPALFEMGSASAVKGLTVYYPEQKSDDIHPYAWTFNLKGNDQTVENITLINSYNGIRIAEPNVRHRIRSIVGTVLRRGIYVDRCVDIGRIENVQFHCHWWSDKAFGGDWDKIYEYMWKNCEAFIFGRTDWEYVTNTFVFPCNIGYKFIGTESGSCNGQFSGIGADAAQQCMVIGRIQYMGLLITNGQFVAFNGDNPVEIVIEPECTGSVRLVNCSFWAGARQNVISRGKGYLSLSDCYFSTDYDWKGQPAKPMVEIFDGKLQLRGCTFASNKPGIALRSGVKSAIVSENNGENGVEVINEIGSKAIIANNEQKK